jgi:hypothetical protein
VSEFEDKTTSLFNLPENAGSKMIEIGGNIWGSSMIGNDASVVKQAFREFFETGKIDFNNYGI